MRIGDGLYDSHSQAAARRVRSGRPIESIEHALAFLRRYAGSRVKDSQQCAALAVARIGRLLHTEVYRSNGRCVAHSVVHQVAHERTQSIRIAENECGL